MIWVTISNLRTLPLKSFLPARNTRKDPREGQNENPLTILKIFSTNVWLFRISKSLMINRNKAPWYGRPLPIHFPNSTKTRGVPSERQKWHLLRILKILSTETWLWCISKIANYHEETQLHHMVDNFPSTYFPSYDFSTRETHERRSENSQDPQYENMILALL